VRARAEAALACLEPDAVAARAQAQQAEWLAIDYRVLAMTDASAAREAVLCVRDDGMPRCAPPYDGWPTPKEGACLD
jgi:hypothetical protein